MISEDWFRLLLAASDGGRRWIRALKAAGDSAKLLNLSDRALRRLGLSLPEIARLRGPFQMPAHWLDWLQSPGNELIVFGSKHYPPRLAELCDAPLALWARSRNPGLLAEPQVAVVGSRRPTRNGQATAESLAAGLSAAGLTITSGLATGIDAAGHRGALRQTGCTVAVLGNGIDSIYPAANRKLADQIIREGVVVSEYAPGTPVRALQFPRRNRIIAGLSLGTIVVEAARRSGSLITARLAAEYGREVFAVPGSIHSALSKGCHKLLRDGAALVESREDVLLEISPQLELLIRAEQQEIPRDPADEIPDSLADSLDYSPMSFDSLVESTGLTAAELSSMLLHLEFQGKIEALPGGRYCRLAKRR